MVRSRIPRPGVEFPRRQVALVGLLAIVALVAVSFARVLVQEYQLNQQKQQLVQQVAALQQQHQQLQTQVAYLQTDAGVEKLAREELGWTRPGDVAVVVVRRGPTPTPIVAPTPTPTPAPAATWQRWGQLLFGARGR
jgi:cell division protein FtsL